VQATRAKQTVQATRIGQALRVAMAETIRAEQDVQATGTKQSCFLLSLFDPSKRSKSIQDSPKNKKQQGHPPRGGKKKCKMTLNQKFTTTTKTNDYGNCSS